MAERFSHGLNQVCAYTFKTPGQTLLVLGRVSDGNFRAGDIQISQTRLLIRINEIR